MVIIDEADELLLDRKIKIKAKYVIALSATPKSDHNPIESKFMIEHLRFAIYDSGIPTECNL